MEALPTQLLPAVAHIKLSIFNIAIPNLIVWGVVIVIFFLAAWARLPRFIERGRRSGEEV